MLNKKEEFIFSRHSKRADTQMGYGKPEKGDKVSDQYPSLTEQGVELAQKLARKEFSEMVERAKNGAIIFISGSSEEERTKAPIEIIGDTLAEQFQDRDEVKVITKKQIDKLRHEGNVLRKIQGIIHENPDKKFILTYPLFLKELSLRPHHREKQTGEHTPYMKELLKRTNYQEAEAAREWFRNKGKIDKDGEILEVPSPQESAETQLHGIKRLRDFAQRFIKDRPLVVGIVGHGFQLDALAVYLANQGKVNYKAFMDLFEGEIMKQPEAAKLTIQGETATFQYRGRNYDVSQELFD